MKHDTRQVIKTDKNRLSHRAFTLHSNAFVLWRQLSRSLPVFQSPIKRRTYVMKIDCNYFKVP